MKISIIDQCSDPGQPGKANEDALCHGTGLACVFDGATGLADAPVFPGEESDAALLSAEAAMWFRQSANGMDAGLLVRRFNTQFRERLARFADPDTLPRFAWPTCGFEMARLVADRLEICGLGDCVAHILAPDGEFASHSALPGNAARETQAARALLDASGGFGPGGGIVRSGKTMDALRAARNLSNDPRSGVWTLGCVPEAGAHVRFLDLPLVAGTRILLMSDGFSALGDTYALYPGDGLIRAASKHGLAALLAELRHLERVEDADAKRFARLKRSDDATAILCEITV